MSTQVTRPQLRGLLASQIKRNVIGALIVSTGVTVLYKIFICDKRKQRYADFYKNYDAEARLKVMNEAGLMQSYIPGK